MFPFSFALFLIGLVALVKGIKESVIGSVTADDIFYTHISIPRHAYRVSIQIWLPSTSILIPKILLRYDGVPSPSEYDRLLEFHLPQKSIQITDDRPTASTLYIGVWGGELMHSYRYFAGSPEISAVMIDSNIDTCSNELEIYNFNVGRCEVLPMLTVPTTTQNSGEVCSTVQLETNQNSWNHMQSILVSNDIRSLYLNLAVKLNEETFREICLFPTSHSSSSLIISFEAYLDQSKEEFNSYFTSFNKTIDQLCSRRNISLSLTLPLPLNGIWILETNMNFSRTSSLLNVTLLADSCLSTTYTSLTTSSSTTLNYLSQLNTIKLEAKHQDPWYSTYNNRPFTSTTSSKPLKVLYMMDLTNTRYQLTPNGKSFQFTLRLDYHLNHSTINNPAIFNSLAYRRLRIIGRIGNIPFPDDKISIKELLNDVAADAPSSFPSSSDLSESEFLAFQSSNDFELLTEEAKSVVIKVKRKSDERILRVIYQWNILHPKLSIVNDLFVDNLYFLVKEDISSSVEVDHVKRDVSFSVVTGYCSPNTCDHGICYMKSNYITTSVCYCKYPWAGERCDQLTVSDWFYQIQIVALTISNLAMIPAIIFSFLQQLYLICIGLFFAMNASIVYHLCDTDYYCLWNLSFLSLQVFDILFCNVMITSVLVFYSPFSEKIHNLLLLIIFGLLLSFTVNNPTSPINLVFSISIALIVNMIGWIYYYCQRKIRKPTLLSKIVNKYKLASAKAKDVLIQRKIISSKVNESSVFLTRRSHKRRDDEEERVDQSRQEEEDGGEDHEEEDDENQIELSTMTSRETSTLLQDGNSSGENGKRRTRSSNSWMKFNQDDHDDLEEKSERKSLFYYHRKHFRRPRHEDEDDPEASDERRKNFYDLSFLRYCSQIKHMLFGVLCGLIGLSCFVLQTRENYWIYHSAWHVLVMIASYLLLKGKYEFFEIIQFEPLKKKWFLDS